jgi:hypothetical protein
MWLTRGSLNSQTNLPFKKVRSNTKKKNLQGNIIIVPLLVENASSWEILKASQFFFVKGQSKWPIAKKKKKNIELSDAPAFGCTP